MVWIHGHGRGIAGFYFLLRIAFKLSKGPYSFCPVCQEFPQGCTWNITSDGRAEHRSFLPLGWNVASSFLHSSFLWVIITVMFVTVLAEGIPETSQYCQSLCSRNSCHITTKTWCSVKVWRSVLFVWAGPTAHLVDRWIFFSDSFSLSALLVMYYCKLDHTLMMLVCDLLILRMGSYKCWIWYQDVVVLPVLCTLLSLYSVDCKSDKL